MGISKNLRFTASSQVISFFFLLGFSVLIARLLGPEGQGQFTLWILIPTLLARFGHLGFDASFAYYAEDERFKYGVVFSIWFFLVLSFLFLCMICIVFYNSNLHEFPKTHTPNFIINTLALLATLFMSRTLLMSLLVGQNKIRLHSGLSILEAVFPLVMLLGLMLFFDLSAEIVFLVMLVTMTLVNAILILECCSVLLLPKRGLTYIAFKYGVKSWTNNILNQLIYRSDLLMVAYFLGVIEVGLYSIALLLVEKSWFFTTAISNALFPILRARDDDDQMLTARLVRVSVFFTLLVSIFLALTGKVLIPFIFGDDFSKSWVPLLWLIPGVIALTIPKILVTQFAAMNKMVFTIYSSGPALAVNVLLNFLLIPEFGLKGAAIATSISYVMYSVLNVYFFTRLTNVQPKLLLLVQKQDWIDFKMVVQDLLVRFFQTNR
jgi:O-antigen/teichoic acid export membrane protein